MARNYERLNDFKIFSSIETHLGWVATLKEIYASMGEDVTLKEIEASLEEQREKYLDLITK